MRIVFIHSLNNFSGSPKVLATIIRALSNKYEVSLITSKTSGFLSDMPKVKYINNYYKWTNNKVLTLILLVTSQIVVFFKILLYTKKDTIFYVNTIIPASASLACKISGKKMVYHVHENMNKQSLLYIYLKFIYDNCNIKSIFVSQYLQDITTEKKNSCVIYNCLDDEFKNKSELYTNSKKETILLIASLRKYKGINEFVLLANLLPNYTFEMVLSSSESEIEHYFMQTDIPSNLTLYSLQNDLHPFYQRAKLLLQLSHPNEWIESFGLTIIEAMAYSIPVIAPNVGGPVEIITNNIDGFTVNPLELEVVKQKIQFLMEDNSTYQRFSRNALQKSKQFKEEEMISKIEKYILQ